jgi:hypothetical protein
MVDFIFLYLNPVSNFLFLYFDLNITCTNFYPFFKQIPFCSLDDQRSLTICLYRTLLRCTVSCQQQKANIIDGTFSNDFCCSKNNAIPNGTVRVLKMGTIPWYQTLLEMKFPINHVYHTVLKILANHFFLFAVDALTMTDMAVNNRQVPYFCSAGFQF